MNKAKKKVIYTILGIVSFVLFLIQYTDNLSPRIGGLGIQFMVPFVICVSIFFKQWVGAMFGFIIGMFMDVTTQNTICYNSLFLIIIACIVGLLFTYVLNNNIMSAILINLVVCGLYFILKWLFFYSSDFTWHMFSSVVLSSIFITAIVGIVMYLIFRAVVKRVDKK